MDFSWVAGHVQSGELAQVVTKEAIEVSALTGYPTMYLSVDPSSMLDPSQRPQVNL